MKLNCKKCIALIISITYLQGCATPKVISLAKGIEKSKVSISANVNDVWLDRIKNEFIICMEDPDANNNKKKKFGFKIPQNLTSKSSIDHIKYKQRNIVEKKPISEQHWWSWSSFRDRKNVKVYDLSIQVDYECNQPTKYTDLVQWVTVSKNFPIEEALLFEGKTINNLLSKKAPFLIVSYKDALLNREDYLCHYQHNKCLMLVTKPSMDSIKNQQTNYSEILIIDELIWKSKPKPMWYLTLPFAVATDIAIIMLITMVLFARPGGA